MGTVYKRNGRWHAQAAIPPGPDGKRARRSRVFRTEREAKAWVRAEESAADRGDAVARDNRTLAALAADWLAARQSALRPRTYESYRDSLDGHVLPRIGHLRVQDLAEQDVARWLADLAKAGVGARSRQLAKQRLDQVLDLAVAWRLAPRNVSRAVDNVSAPAAEAAVWTAAQLRAFLAAAETDHHHPLWHVAAATGLRRGELLGLRWADLDLDAGTLRVAQQVQPVPGGLAIGPPKTESARRVVALPPSLLPMLRAHRDRQTFRRAKAGPLWRDLDLVFCVATGGPINPNNLYRSMNALMDRAGVPRITLHQIRHTHITHALATGEPIGVVSRRAGHARTSITMDVYGHLLEGQDRALADRFDALIAPEDTGT